MSWPTLILLGSALYLCLACLIGCWLGANDAANEANARAEATIRKQYPCL